MWVQQKVCERIRDNSRFESDYVEGINNQSGQFERYAKSREYFADIVAAYLSRDLSLPKEDKEIVEFVIQKVDPDFDVYDSNHLASQVIRKACIIRDEKQGKNNDKRSAEEVQSYINHLINKKHESKE